MARWTAVFSNSTPLVTNNLDQKCDLGLHLNKIISRTLAKDHLDQEITLHAIKSNFYFS